MTFIVDKLEEEYREYKEDFAVFKISDQMNKRYEIEGYAYLNGFADAIEIVKEAEEELQKLIWQAWVNEGVEPR